MIRKIDFSENVAALQVLSLQLASYQAEAAVIGFSDFPPLKDSIESLRRSEETFIGWFETQESDQQGDPGESGNGGSNAEELAGCVAYRRNGKTVEISRMMVHPRHFRRKIADRLLDYLAESEKTAERFTVSAVTSNSPAVALYTKHGFRKKSEQKLVAGFFLGDYVKDTRCLE
ncbi:GNAT family N-acetyltransferase [Gorillibacterium massiliense]|uniref:GNAT family N-acetyltransferase n=1 Tax=Gorillibacterium massiliense TaxID=1280390 RepID=UPI0004BCBFED|nr:GNAT family N-acetyltransferase [Gorillibacterium massiliense]